MEVEHAYDTLEQGHEEYQVDSIDRNVYRGVGAIAHYLELDSIIEAYRKPHYWVNSIVLPNLMISLFGFAVFFIDPVGNTEFYSDRISLLMSVVLTSVAFQFTVSAVVPTLSYMTCLDKWRNTMNLIFLFTFLECTYIQCLMEFHGGLHDAPDVWPIDRTCLVLAFGFMCISTYYYIFSYVSPLELMFGSWSANIPNKRNQFSESAEAPLNDRFNDSGPSSQSPTAMARNYGSIEHSFGMEGSPLLPEAPATSTEMSDFHRNLGQMEEERKQFTNNLLAKERYLFGLMRGGGGGGQGGVQRSAGVSS